MTATDHRTRTAADARHRLDADALAAARRAADTAPALTDPAIALLRGTGLPGCEAA